MKFYNKEFIKNGETIEITNADVKNTGELTDFVNSVRKESKYLSHGEFDPPMTIEKQNEFILSFENSNSVYLVALLNKKIIATGILTGGNKIRDKHECELGIVVLKKYWNLGVASKLMKNLIDCAKQIGFEQINLNVIASNMSAIALYKKYVFTEYGIISHDCKYEDGTYDDTINMAKYLN